MICDGMATETLVDWRRYAQSLLRLVAMVPLGESSRVSHAIGIFDSDILEKRIMTIRMKKEKVNASMKNGLMVAGTLLLCAVAGVSGAMTRAVEAQTSSGAVKKAVRRSLACTYYDAENRTYAGTCGMVKGDPTWYCFRNDDKSVRQRQSGCAPEPRK